MEDQILLTRKSAELLAEKPKFLKKLRDTSVKLSIKENVVILEAESASNLLAVKNCLVAFNRGFGTAVAAMLLNDEYDIQVINLNDYTTSKKRQYELKARVIGSRGAIKDRLSRATSCFIKVKGKTISIIGTYQRLAIAFEAVDAILNGAKHETAFVIINKRLGELYINGSSRGISEETTGD